MLTEFLKYKLTLSCQQHKVTPTPDRHWSGHAQWVLQCTCHFSLTQYIGCGKFDHSLVLAMSNTHIYSRHRTSTNNRIWQRMASLLSIRLLFHSRESFSVHERVSFNIVVLPPKSKSLILIFNRTCEYIIT